MSAVVDRNLYPISQLTGLELDYAPSHWNHRNLSPDEAIAQHISIISNESKSARDELFIVRNISYGSTAKNEIDLYFSDSTIETGRPLVAYVHGGYWNALCKEDSAYLARSLCTSEAKAVFASIGYVLAAEKTFGETASSMERRCNDMGKALLALKSITVSLKCSGIYLCGHSAGAHLAVMMLSQKYDDAIATEIFTLFKGVWLLSGIYNLEPISRTRVNDPLQLTKEEIQKCSPVNCIQQMTENMTLSPRAVVRIIYGEHDPPAFRQQANDYYQKLVVAAIKTNELSVCIETPVQVADRDHFDLVDNLHDSYVITDMLHVLVRNTFNENSWKRSSEQIHIDVKSLNFHDLLRH